MRRRLVHLAAGVSIAAAGLLLSRGATLALVGTLAALALLVELLRFSFPGLNRRLVRAFRALLKEREATQVTGATYLLLSSLACLALFDREVAVLAILYLAVGDPIAAVVGQNVRRPRLFGKSLAGAAAFVSAATAVAAATSALGVVDFRWPLVAGGVAGALAEVAPLPLDDNLSVPAASGLMMTALGTT